MANETSGNYIRLRRFNRDHGFAGFLNSGWMKIWLPGNYSNGYGNSFTVRLFVV